MFLDLFFKAWTWVLLAREKSSKDIGILKKDKNGLKIIEPKILKTDTNMVPQTEKYQIFEKHKLFSYFEILVENWSI